MLSEESRARSEGMSSAILTLFVASRNANASFPWPAALRYMRLCLTFFFMDGNSPQYSTLSHFYSHGLTLFEISGFVFAPSSCPANCCHIRLASVRLTWPENLCSIWTYRNSLTIAEKPTASACLVSPCCFKYSCARTAGEGRRSL